MTKQVATLYWIHLASQRDARKQGYVGVTLWTTSRRLYQLQRRHPKIFKQPTIRVDILFRGSRSTCWALEKSLRPKFKIGWNKFVGGKFGGSDYVFGPQQDGVRGKQSKDMHRLWATPKFREQMTALHNRPITKARFTRMMKSLWADPIYREKMSIALRKTPEQKTAASKAGKVRWRDPEYREMMSVSMKGKVGIAPKSEDTKAKMRATALARYSDPAERARTGRSVRKALRLIED
jgi:hypothetical protein